MARSILSRYLDPDVLQYLADRPIEPRSLVFGNLAGAHRSPLSGFAVEFAGHREYVPGDDPRRLDWRVYFTRDKHFIKQYELETNLVCHLIVDISASMRYGDGDQQKLTYAAGMAVMMGYSVVRQNDKVSFSTFDDRVREFIAPSSSMDQVTRMTRHLDDVQPTENTHIADCLREAQGRMGRREIVMVFSDFLTDLSQLESAVQRLRYDQHEVVLFHVLHHDERTFELDGMVKFVGLEAADEVLAQGEDLRHGYLQAFDRFQQRLARLARQNRCELVSVDTSRGLGATLVDYLNQRSSRNRGR